MPRFEIPAVAGDDVGALGGAQLLGVGVVPRHDTQDDVAGRFVDHHPPILEILRAAPH